MGFDCSVPFFGTSGNGRDFFVMQSNEYLQSLLQCFEYAADAGFDPNMVKDKIFKEVGCSEDDLTESDKKLLVKAVERMYR